MPGSGIPRAGAPPTPPALILTLAVVANLLVASTAAMAVAPVGSSRALLDGYDGMPELLRGVLGDTTQARGPIGTWIAAFYENALKASPAAQLAMRLDLRSDTPTGEWTSADEVTVTWRNYGAPLDYHIAVTTNPTPTSLTGARLTQEPQATVALPAGESWVHVQASHQGKTGPITTLGPFRSDPVPPPAPVVLGAPTLTVEDYHFPLQWQPVTALSGIAAYVIERHGTSGWETIARVDSETTTHQERNRPNGDHVYRVRAESGAGLLSAADGTDTLRVRVDARSNLEQPGYGEWHRGFNVIYDSLLYTYDIHDPSRYATVGELQAGAGMTAADYALYTGPGWGIPLENRTMRQIVADTIGARLLPNGDLVGGEQNALTISLLLFEWLFDATDYDFARLEGGNFDLLRANETLDRGGGVCGDLTALYITMLRIAGVPSRPVHGYLINDGAPGQSFQAIGGFHMWAEVFVGGDATTGPGQGWIPVDVSGVTGSYDEKYLHVYFGVANPNYLQLGIQDDLGDEALGDDHKRNRWNVWANLEWTWYDSNGASQPTVNFNADAHIDETLAERGRIWFTPESAERVYCPNRANSPCQGTHTHYFDNVKGRSVRSMDYGATVTWTGNVHELRLTVRTPEGPAPTQVAMWTVYERGTDCAARLSTPMAGPPGTVIWTIAGDARPCA